MKLIDITCPKCKAVMKVDKSKKELTCEFCGNKILIDDEVKKVKILHAGQITEEQEFKKFVRNFFELTPNATITGEYTISINYDKLITNPNYIVKIKPLLYEGKSKEISDKPIIFKKLELKDLSEFYIVEFNGPEVISKMIKIPTRNIPELDTRISAIASTMFEDQNDFLRYLSFILSDDYLSILLDENYRKNSRKSQIFNNNYTICQL